MSTGRSHIGRKRSARALPADARCTWCAVKVRADLAPTHPRRAVWDHLTPLAVLPGQPYCPECPPGVPGAVVISCARCNGRRGSLSVLAWLDVIVVYDLDLRAA